ncbi:hypothetical protein [uncultured Methanobrevibacter sp.]|nr:hypothetical protein [uncultured Methanobrevibacter sp.]
MDTYIQNQYSSHYDDDRLLTESKIEEIASELSREITQEINQQFEKVLK